MGDGDDRPLVFLQMVLQPLHRFGVEVVGGLVEQQDVGLLQQQAAQGHAPLFAAGEVGHRGVAGRAAQGVHGVLQAVVQVPGVHFVEFFLDGGLAGDQFFHVGLAQVGIGEALVDRSNSASLSSTGCTASEMTCLTVFSGSSCGSCSRKPSE